MIETERLKFRRFVDDDLPLLIEQRSDPEVNKYLGGPARQNAEALSTRIKFYMDCVDKFGFGMCPMILKETGEIIGGAGLQPLEDTGEVEVGYSLIKKYWGQGLGTEAAVQKSGDEILDALRRNARPRGAEAMGAIDFPVNVGPKTDLASEKDGGELMKISGTVYQADGKTPAPNTLIYLYHTDTEGYYGRGSNEHKHGRYRGWMLTNKDGSFAFVTIKPAPYPEQRWSAHIHMTVTTPTAREDWVDSILFEGDRLISSRERETAGNRGGFNPIVTLKKGDGGLYYATRDIRLLA